KISTRLLDIETGDHLWQDSHKGVMDDIFDIQETVATKVVEALQIHLTKEEKSKVLERGTENAEAYEYFMRAGDLMGLHTRESYRQCIALQDLAISLDPNFFEAMIGKSSVMLLLFGGYGRDPELGAETEKLLFKLDSMKPNLWEVHQQLSVLYFYQGRFEDADREHRIHITLDDGSGISKGHLGYFCYLRKEYAKAFEYYEASINLNAGSDYLTDSTDSVNYWNVIINAHKAGNSEGMQRWSERAIAALQKRLGLHPENVFARYWLAATYFWSIPQRKDEAMKALAPLEDLSDLDSHIQYQVATILAEVAENDRALASLRKALRSGADVHKALLPDSPFSHLFGSPDFELIMKEYKDKTNG
ncbi:MAG: hypothetical protein ACHQM6_11340, partial [Candidatus Kapaibacterium sp.]